MVGDLRSAWGKISRAEHHREALEARLAAWVKAYPVRISAERDLEAAAYVFKVWNLPVPDPQLGFIIGDCVHNARSALDHLAYQLALVGKDGQLSRSQERAIQFPIFSECDNYRKEYWRIKPLRPQDAARIEELQPYNGRNEEIWGASTRIGRWKELLVWSAFAPIPRILNMLSVLDNADKHRAVHPTWVSFDLGWDVAFPEGLGVTSRSGFERPLEEGAVIARWHFDGAPPPIPAEMRMESYFALDVGIGEMFDLDMGLAFGSRGVVDILADIIVTVRNVVRMFEPCILHGAPPAPLMLWDPDA